MIFKILNCDLWIWVSHQVSTFPFDAPFSCVLTVCYMIFPVFLVG